MPRPIFDDDEPLLDYNSMDDLAELGMGDRGYADVDPPYGSNEIFGDQFERRAREKNRDGGMPGMPSVAVLDPKTGPWTGNNQVGNEVEFSPQANNEQTILRLDEWGMPAPWTLTLGLDIQDADLPSGGFDATAQIFFGSGGITQYVEIDWLEGATITLPMNAINVVAKYNFGINEGGGATLPTGLRLRASICRYPTTTGKATRSFLFALAGGPQIIARIPPFAKNVLVYPNSPSVGVTAFTLYGGAFQVRFFAAFPPAQNLAQYDISQFVSFLDVPNQVVGHPEPIPIGSRARFVAITDLAGNIITANNLEAAFQFEIGL